MMSKGTYAMIYYRIESQSCIIWRYCVALSKMIYYRIERYEEAYTFTDPYCSATVCGELINPEAPGSALLAIRAPSEKVTGPPVISLEDVYAKVYIPNANPDIDTNADYYTGTDARLYWSVIVSIGISPGWTGLYDKSKIAYRVFKIETAQCTFNSIVDHRDAKYWNNKLGYQTLLEMFDAYNLMIYYRIESVSKLSQLLYQGDHLDDLL